MIIGWFCIFSNNIRYAEVKHTNFLMDVCVCVCVCVKDLRNHKSLKFKKSCGVSMSTFAKSSVKNVGQNFLCANACIYKADCFTAQN